MSAPAPAPGDEPTGPESVEDYYARIVAATDDEGRLPVAVEEMPGWDIYPYELDSLRLKPLQALADEEPPRRGEDPADCWCAAPTEDPDTLVWANARWKLSLARETGLPIALWLSPLEHHDIPNLPTELGAELGQLIVAIGEAVEHLPSVGRFQLAKYGDGGAHGHVFFMGRPARILQFRGSPLIDWEENLPRVPLDVLQRNGREVAARLVVHLGGRTGSLGR